MDKEEIKENTNNSKTDDDNLDTQTAENDVEAKKSEYKK